MSTAVTTLWRLVRATPSIDAKALAQAVEAAAGEADDFRTRLLIWDSVRAIESHWGEQQLRKWISTCPSGKQIQSICDAMSREAPDEHGFPSIKRRIVDAIDPKDVLDFLRDLARKVFKPTRLVIGGSIALIMSGHLQRLTEDMDVVDEVPEDIRGQHELLAELDHRYGFQLSHFQSHYLPTGWEQRIHSIATFGQLQAFIVDAYDVFLTKVFSNRSKDKDDLRAVVPHLDKTILETRLRDTTAALRGEPKLLDAAKENWYVLFGQPLPS
jgi:hypothetical protein